MFAPTSLPTSDRAERAQDYSTAMFLSSLGTSTLMLIVTLMAFLLLSLTSFKLFLCVGIALRRTLHIRSVDFLTSSFMYLSREDGMIFDLCMPRRSLLSVWRA